MSGTGQLRSPYHPNSYPHNKDCQWVINQPEGYVVTLNFLSFDVEGGSCRFDFVEVNKCPIHKIILLELNMKLTQMTNTPCHALPL